MEKAIVLTGAVLMCAVITGCGSTHYTEVTGPNGGTATHVSVATGTSATTPNGGCINTAGGTCQHSPNTATE